MKMQRVRLVLLSLLIVLAGCTGQRSKPEDASTADLGRVEALLHQGRYAEALPLAKENLATAQKSLLAPDAPGMAAPLRDLGEADYRLGANQDAEKYYLQALAILQKRDGVDSRSVAMVLADLGRNEDAAGALDDSEAHLQAALTILQKLHDPALPVVLVDLGETDFDRGQQAAVVLDDFQRAAALFDTAPADMRRDHARAFSDSAYVLLNTTGDAKGAHSALHQALALVDVQGCASCPELGDAFEYEGEVDLAEGNYAAGEPLFQRALGVYQNSLGMVSRNRAGSLNDLARTYDDQGHYQKAEEYYQQAIDAFTQLEGPDGVDVATTVSNMADPYLDTGRYEQAAALLERAVAMSDKQHLVSDSDLLGRAMKYSNLGVVYFDLARYPEAERSTKKAIEIWRAHSTTDNASLARFLTNLGETYSAEGRYPEAETSTKQALDIVSRTPDNNVPVLVGSTHTLGQVYEDEGKLKEAEAQFREALRIAETKLGPNDQNVATELQHLGYLYLLEKRYPEAETVLRRSLKVYAQTFGPLSMHFTATLGNYASSQFSQGHWREASESYGEVMTRDHELLRQQFGFMSERERLQFIGIMDVDVDVYFSICLRYHERDQQLAGKMYDVLLWEKGFVGNSIATLRAKIAASGDAQAEDLLEQLSAKKTGLAALLDTPGADHAAWQAQVERLQQQADALEKQLVERSGAFGEEKALQAATWRDVQKALKPGEAAVEFVRVRYNEGAGYDGKAYYVALVVTPQTRTAPEFIVVGSAVDMEAGPVADYANRIRKSDPVGTADKTTFYGTFWRPLLPALKGATRVFLAPDGILNQASLGIVADDAGKLLLERYDLHIVSSTRDVLRGQTATGTDTAVVVGGPTFSLGGADYLAAVGKLQRPALDPSQGPMLAANEAGSSANRVSRDFAGAHCPLPDTGILCPLPGAAEEVSGIDGLLTKHQWQASLYQGDLALEEAVMQVHHPRLLHLATHGFFLPDQKSINEDPMLRSGLYFAGADNALGGNPPPPGADNGILTAYEAAQLDLEGTELVVLSACDTGLGTASNGEGVFGLNRALQEAGAQAVMMSMWSVPDQETRELMQRFYKHWLSGMDKHEALRQAELEERGVVKQRYGHDLPYYWGAFVMVGP